LSPATLAALRGQLTEQRIGLPTWRFRTDPDDAGRAAGWSAAAADDAAAPWRDLAAGKHWEAQADDLKHYTGVAWYRIAVDVPTNWRGATSRLVLEGVDDSYELWIDGAPVAKAGDPATKQTVWLEKQVVELEDRLAPGRHVLALRVVDHAGAGGLWRPAYLTTGPAGAAAPRLH
jgi:beta-galactosidase/beta-glucuronidase